MCSSDLFSTADDNQPAVTVKVYQGEREFVQNNKLLGEFNLEGIPPAKRGVPQIEVTLDIDANGIMHVSAKDKGTGKENKITIKSNSGLTDSEIQSMIKDAEDNAEEDRKRKMLIETKNFAEGQVNSVRKEKDESELPQEEKDKIESAIAELETALKGDDKDLIMDKLNAMTEVAKPIYEARQKKQQEEQSANTTEEVKEG